MIKAKYATAKDIWLYAGIVINGLSGKLYEYWTNVFYATESDMEDNRQLFSPKRLGSAQRVLLQNNSPTPKASRLHNFTPSKSSNLCKNVITIDIEHTPTSHKIISKPIFSTKPNSPQASRAAEAPLEFDAPKYFDFTRIDQDENIDEWFEKRNPTPEYDKRAYNSKILVPTIENGSSPAKITKENEGSNVHEISTSEKKEIIKAKSIKIEVEGEPDATVEEIITYTEREKTVKFAAKTPLKKIL